MQNFCNTTQNCNICLNILTQWPRKDVVQRIYLQTLIIFVRVLEMWFLYIGNVNIHGKAGHEIWTWYWRCNLRLLTNRIYIWDKQQWIWHVERTFSLQLLTKAFVDISVYLTNLLSIKRTGHCNIVQTFCNHFARIRDILYKMTPPIRRKWGWMNYNVIWPIEFKGAYE